MLRELVDKAFTKFSFLNSSERALKSQRNVSIPIWTPTTDQSYWETPASTGPNCSKDEAGRFVCHSGYSNCVHDVAVGNFDLCIADLWITPGRSAIAQFLPPVRFDMFYLVQPAKPRTELDLIPIMGRPFKPFTLGAWVAIGIFMLLSALCFLVGLHFEDPKKQSNERGNGTPPAPAHQNTTTSLASQKAHDLWDRMGCAKSFANSSTASCKIVGFGFAWAMLVLSTTYTATRVH